MAIRSIKHKALRRLWEQGNARGIPAGSTAKLERMLSVVDASSGPDALKGASLPGWKLHELKGDRIGWWSMWLTGNWRLLMRFDEAGNALDLDLEDYH